MFILYVTDVLLEEVSEGVLSGVVTNGQTPLEGVEVTIKDSETKCTTDEKGFYEFKELEAGNYTLTFNKTGYRYIEQSDIIVEMGDTAKINTTLEELPTYSASIDNRIYRLLDRIRFRRYIYIPTSISIQPIRTNHRTLRVKQRYTDSERRE